MKFPELIRLTLLATALLLSLPAAGHAEPPAQSIHWGAIGYPDHDRTLALGLTVVDRFTEFDGAGKRYNDIRETMGFNFFSLSWTERLETLKGWNANFTAGGGPTRDGFSRFLQNDVIHKLRGFDPVPVGNKRETDDFMISSSLTRWMSLWGSGDVFFAGVGAAGGSLYYEPYAQAGFRRLSPFAAVPWVSDHLRISAMGRVGRPFGGAAIRDPPPGQDQGEDQGEWVSEGERDGERGGWGEAWAGVGVGRWGLGGSEVVHCASLAMSSLGPCYRPVVADGCGATDNTPCKTIRPLRTTGERPDGRARALRTRSRHHRRPRRTGCARVVVAVS